MFSLFWDEDDDDDIRRAASIPDDNDDDGDLGVARQYMQKSGSI